MGGQHSCTSFKYDKSVENEENGTLSEPLSPPKVTVDLDTTISIDVNHCTEEELMCMPGINRRLAQYIVQHRPYTEPQELALLPKIGWKRLLPIMRTCSIRTASSVHHPSSGSSLSSSRLGMPERRIDITTSMPLGNPCEPKLCINECSPKELLDQFPWLHPSIAYRIVRHRRRHGSFSMIEQLVSVKGVDSAMLQVIRPYLSLYPVPQPQGQLAAPKQLHASPSLHIMLAHATASEQDRHSLASLPTPATKDGDTASSAFHESPSHTHNGFSSSRPASTNFTQIPPSLRQMNRLAECFTASQLDLLVCMEPLRQKVLRPIRPEFTYSTAGREALRWAWWQDVGEGGLVWDRVRENPGVREVIALTLLEMGWSCLCFHHTTVEEPALLKLCEDVNQPTLPNIKRWYGYRGQWSCALLPTNPQSPSPHTSTNGVGVGVGCLYDTKRISRVQIVPLVVASSSVSVAVVVLHPVNSNTVVSITRVQQENDAPNDAKTTLTWVEVQNKLAELGLADVETVVVTSTAAALLDESELSRAGLHSVAVPLESPCSQSTQNGTKQEDPVDSAQMWLSSGAMSLWSCNGGQVRLGLTHPLLPTCAGRWNGALCREGPVWLELFSSLSTKSELV